MEKYLKTLPETVERMYRIAGIGEMDDRLAEPEMLYLLLEMGIGSPLDLRRNIEGDEADFIRRLGDAAVRNKLEWLPAVSTAKAWITAVRHGPAGRHTHQAVPAITGVSPPEGPTAGGTHVTITGYGFDNASNVEFGTATASAYTVDSDTCITATTAPWAAGATDVRVTTPGGTTGAADADRYTYVAATKLTRISPSSGPPGACVTITGAGFKNTAGVMFGTVPAASFTVASETRIDATAPTDHAGTVDVRVTTAGGTSATSRHSHYGFLSPKVSGVSPSLGPVNGGTTVTITGTSLKRATAVAFGNASAAITSNGDDTSITATAPAAGAAGQVPVTVTTPCGASSNTRSCFTYLPTPSVDAVQPDHQPRAGGGSVTIKGTGFTSPSNVFFGTASAAGVKLVDHATIIATAPPGAVGTVDVTVTTLGGASAHSSNDHCTYD